MSGWKDDDEVTTTYGSIQLSLEQAHTAGIKTERERIIKLLEESITLDSITYKRMTLPETWELLLPSLVALIKGETNE